MKKNICVILVIITFVFLIGCSKELTPKIKVPGSTGNAKPKVDVFKA